MSDIYTASCNPPRRAKRPSTSQSSTSVPPTASKPIPILPKQASAAPTEPAVQDPVADAPPPHQPAKRGRKPGPLSRAAREAQRRLNHSIIEKARRTKINEALATLREMVPPEYSQPKVSKGGDSDEEDDEEYQPATNKPKKAGKKEEKEKEFKLEILVRTVAYMKDLVRRVGESDQKHSAQGPSVCTNCQSRSSSHRKRPREGDDGLDEVDAERHTRRQRTSISTSASVDISDSPELPLVSSVRLTSAQTPLLDGPLPSISSWLPEGHASERNWPLKEKNRTPPSHLPSPPSSTRVDPILPHQLPPSLNLGPSSTASVSSITSVRTPEDESAATLLLQIAGGSSPSFRPVSDSPDTVKGLTRRLSVSALRPIPGDEAVYLGADQQLSTLASSGTNVRGELPVGGPRRVETPASLLGIRDLSGRPWKV